MTAKAKGTGLNPLAGLDPHSVRFSEDAAAMAEALVNGAGSFEACARDLLTVLFLRELRRGELQPIQSTAARQTEFLLKRQQVSDEDA
jgi:hypothetical protein